jgi:hypothetical protein
MIKETQYDEGEEILMEIPSLTEEGKGNDSAVVEAVYVGRWNSSIVDAEIKAGRLKSILFISGVDAHHIVNFADQNWVNDLVGYHIDDLKFNPISQAN